MELQEIDLRCFEPCQRPIDLGLVGLFKLGGDEDLVAQARGCHHLAEHMLGIAIGGGSVDEPTAGVDQRPNDLRGGAPRPLVVVVEHAGGADADRRHALPRARNSSNDEWCLATLREGGPRQQWAVTSAVKSRRVVRVIVSLPRLRRADGAARRSCAHRVRDPVVQSPYRANGKGHSEDTGN